MKKTICVDLDGVLADYSKGWQGVDHIGDPIPGAVEFVKKLNELGRVVIYTARMIPHQPFGDRRKIVADWLQKHGFDYDDIYDGRGKPIAAAYIDDRAVPCNPLPASKLMRTEDNAAEWHLAVGRTRQLLERNDGFVSDSGPTV